MRVNFARREGFAIDGGFVGGAVPTQKEESLRPPMKSGPPALGTYPVGVPETACTPFTHTKAVVPS